VALAGHDAILPDYCGVDNRQVGTLTNGMRSSLTAARWNHSSAPRSPWRPRP